MHSNLPLFTPLPTTEEMHLWDTTSQDAFGIPAVLLMENASRAAFSVLHRHTELNAQTRVLILMGGGNNGGDGAALARHLHNYGCRVLVYHTGDLDQMSEAACAHIRMAQNIGVCFLPLTRSEEFMLPLEWRTPDIIVDALCGIGMKGLLRPLEQILVEIVNTHSKHSLICSLDIPTGLCGNTGRPLPVAVQAQMTIAFEAAQPGLYFPEAKKYTGEIHVKNIGLPAGVKELIPASWRLLTPRPGSWATPSPLMHKGSAGRVMIVGGCRSMAGAPLLAGIGALRTGAGTVHIACPGKAEPVIRHSWPEVLTHAIGDEVDWTSDMTSFLDDLIKNTAPHALIIGPGMGRNQAAGEIIATVLAQPERCPVIVDADALFFFNGAAEEENVPSLFSLLRETDILTPHPGEMARILPQSFFQTFGNLDSEGCRLAAIDIVQNNRIEAVNTFKEFSPAVLVLKGVGTLVGHCKSPTTISPYALPSLAIGGSGDVLAGIIGALVAGGMPSSEAAGLGVYLHCRAGEILAEKAPRGHVAREVAEEIPRAFAELCR